MDPRERAEKLADDLQTVTDGTLSDLLAYLNIEIPASEPRKVVITTLSNEIHDDYTLGTREIALIVSIAARINRKINDTYKNLKRDAVTG